MPEMLTISDIALRSGRDYFRVRADLFRGLLRGRKTETGRLVIERESAEEYIANARRQPQPAA